MNEPLKQLQGLLARQVPNAFLLLKDHGWGAGYLHVYQGGAEVIAEYRENHGFGVTLFREADTGFENPDEVHPDEQSAATAISRLLAAHGTPTYDTTLTDGLNATSCAISEVMAMHFSDRGMDEVHARLKAIADGLEGMTDDPGSVVASLETFEQRLRAEGPHLSSDSARAKLEAAADRILHLANMTASADKARRLHAESHQ
jgi:hypothetical protein